MVQHLGRALEAGLAPIGGPPSPVAQADPDPSHWRRHFPALAQSAVSYTHLTLPTILLV